MTMWDLVFMCIYVVCAALALALLLTWWRLRERLKEELRAATGAATQTAPEHRRYRTVCKRCGEKFSYGLADLAETVTAPCPICPDGRGYGIHYPRNREHRP